MFKKIEVVRKFFSQLSKRERAVLYIAVIFVSISLLDRLFVYPVYSRIDSLNREIKEKETGISRDLRILEQKERIIGEAKNFAPFFIKSQSEEEETVVFMKEIESISSKSSLYIIDMKPAGSKTEKSSIKRFTVNLSCEGQMEQIMDFMYNIENSNELLVIERYQLNPKSKESMLIQCNLAISKLIMP